MNKEQYLIKSGLRKLRDELNLTDSHRVTEYINIDSISVDRHSLTPQTLSIVHHIMNGGLLPPIHVSNNWNGSYKIKDGRHRITAHKLLGLKKIKARFSIKKRDITLVGLTLESACSAIRMMKNLKLNI